MSDAYHGDKAGRVTTMRQFTFWCAYCEAVHCCTEHYVEVARRNAEQGGWEHRDAGWTCPGCCRRQALGGES